MTDTQQPETPEGKKKNKFAAWWGRQKTWAKIAMIAGAVVIVILGIVLGGGSGSEPPEAQSTPAVTGQQSPSPSPTDSTKLTDATAKSVCEAQAVKDQSTFVPQVTRPATAQLVNDVWWVNMRGKIRDGSGAKYVYVVHCQIGGTEQAPTVVDYHADVETGE